MNETSKPLQVWINLLVCLCVPIMVAGFLYSRGEPEDIILLKTLVSAMFVASSVGTSKASVTRIKAARRLNLEWFREYFNDALMFSAWLTIILWQPGEPVQESLWAFGIQFTVFFLIAVIANLFRYKSSTE